jgi:hypothetical protein
MHDEDVCDGSDFGFATPPRVRIIIKNNNNNNNNNTSKYLKPRVVYYDIQVEAVSDQIMISVDEGTEKRKIGLYKCIHKPLIYPINLEDTPSISYQIFLLFCFSLLMMSLRHFSFKNSS